MLAGALHRARYHSPCQAEHPARPRPDPTATRPDPTRPDPNTNCNLRPRSRPANPLSAPPAGDDDGETTDWITSPGTASSTLLLSWSEAQQCLSWTRTGAYVGPRSFTQLAVTAFAVGGAAPKTAPAQDIGSSGSACPA